MHEGFCLPPLEAMAAGAPVVCTDAHGNRDFCVHEQNCLMVEPDPASVAAGIERVLADAALRERLVAGGLATVGEYAWERRIDQLEEFLAARGRPGAARSSGAVPGRAPTMREADSPSCCAARAAGPTRTLALPRARATSARCARAQLTVLGRAAATFEVRGGIMHLLHDPPEFVGARPPASSASPRRCAPTAGTSERILALPDEDQGYWRDQRLAMNHVLADAGFEPGQRLLDVGSNTCWASNILAREGLEVIALDIATAQMQGLKTADWFLETGEVFFERMLSVMYDPALASESVDYVFCCEVLHHNDVANLRRTLRELYRVLTPGRQAVPRRTSRCASRWLKRDHAEEVAEFEGNEHVHFFHQYSARPAPRVRGRRPWPRPASSPAVDTAAAARGATRGLPRAGRRYLRELT